MLFSIAVPMTSPLMLHEGFSFPLVHREGGREWHLPSMLTWMRMFAQACERLSTEPSTHMRTCQILKLRLRKISQQNVLEWRS